MCHDGLYITLVQYLCVTMVHKLFNKILIHNDYIQMKTTNYYRPQYLIFLK